MDDDPKAPVADHPGVGHPTLGEAREPSAEVSEAVDQGIHGKQLEQPAHLGRPDGVRVSVISPRRRFGVLKGNGAGQFRDPAFKVADL